MNAPAASARLTLSLLIVGLASPARAELTGGQQLAAVYNSILDARFERAENEFKRACPPAPMEACQAVHAALLWWQIWTNPESRQLDSRFEREVVDAVAATQAWTKREPMRAEAWFYLAGAYAPRVQWRILRGQRVAAAYDGKNIKEALERALKLDPGLADANFGLGLYHYYADVAPAAAKMLRWLLALPGGDRAKGLREMLEVQNRGQLLAGEADYQLQRIYLWYEHKTNDALQLLANLSASYPYNPIFRQEIAENRDTYLHDHEGSAAMWRDLLDRATALRVYSPATVAVRARLGLAGQLAAMNQLDQAIEHLTIITTTRPSEPAGATARAERELRALVARKSSNRPSSF